MSNKSEAYYRFCQDRSAGRFSYYDPEEIDQIACDLLDDGNVDDAAYVAEMGLKQHPDDKNTLRLYIWICIHNKNVDKAEELFERIKDDDDVVTKRLWFCLNVMNGHPQLALTTFTQNVICEEISPADWINTIEEMSEAIPKKLLKSYLNRIGALKDLDAETIGRIAAKLMDCGELADAVPLLNRSLDKNAYDIYSWQDLANCYFELGETEKAAEACDYGLAVDDQSAMLNFMRGFIHYQNCEWEEATKNLEVARRFAEGKLKSDIPPIPDEKLEDNINFTYTMLAHSYQQQGRDKEAKECYGILLERTPLDVDLIMQVTALYLSEGDLQTAIDYAHMALDAEPDNAEVHAILVSIYTTMHMFEDASEHLRAILRVKPDNSNYLLAYAELQAHIGNAEEADKSYRKILELKPRDKNTRALLRNYFTSIGDTEALAKLRKK